MRRTPEDCSYRALLGEHHRKLIQDIRAHFNRLLSISLVVTSPKTSRSSDMTIECALLSKTEHNPMSRTLKEFHRIISSQRNQSYFDKYYPRATLCKLYQWTSETKRQVPSINTIIVCTVFRLNHKLLTRKQ